MPNMNVGQWSLLNLWQRFSAECAVGGSYVLHDDLSARSIASRSFSGQKAHHIGLDLFWVGSVSEYPKEVNPVPRFDAGDWGFYSRGYEIIHETVDTRDPTEIAARIFLRFVRRVRLGRRVGVYPWRGDYA